MKYLCFIFLLIPTALWGYHDTQVSSLDDYNQQIIHLQEQKENLSTSWEEFRNSNGTLTDFIKTNLSQKEREKLTSIVELYLNNLRENKADMQLRKKFYLDIKPFVEDGKQEHFKKYSDMSINVETERQILSENIKETEEQKQARTDLLRTQIADNALDRRQNIKQRIEPLLRERLDTYTKSETFQRLHNDRKALVF
jgi:hypothetical protein